MYIHIFTTGQQREEAMCLLLEYNTMPHLKVVTIHCGTCSCYTTSMRIVQSCVLLHLPVFLANFSVPLTQKRFIVYALWDERGLFYHLLKSTGSEWSMSRSVGHLGLTRSGLMPCLVTTSLMAARSTMAGMPLCIKQKQLHCLITLSKRVSKIYK